jgi:type VI secretion system protein VasI
MFFKYAKKFTFIILAFLMSTLAFSEDQNYSENDLNQKLANILNIKDDKDRLAEYDKLANEVKESPKEFNTSFSNWNVSSDIDPIDDSKVFYLSVRSSTDERLMIRAKKEQVELYIVWGIYLGNDSNEINDYMKYVTFRVGKNQSSTDSWSCSTDSRSTFYPNDINELLDKMKDAETMVARVTPYQENPRTAIFNTSGFKDEWDKISKELSLNLNNN